MPDVSRIKQMTSIVRFVSINERSQQEDKHSEVQYRI